MGLSERASLAKDEDEEVLWRNSRASIVWLREGELAIRWWIAVWDRVAVLDGLRSLTVEVEGIEELDGERARWGDDAAGDVGNMNEPTLLGWGVVWVDGRGVVK